MKETYVLSIVREREDRSYGMGVAKHSTIFWLPYIVALWALCKYVSFESEVAHRIGVTADSQDGRLGCEVLTYRKCSDLRPGTLSQIMSNTIPRSSRDSELILACCKTICLSMGNNTVALAFFR